MGHSLSRTNLTIKSLYIKDGGEKADYILVSDAKGMANWKKPSNYIPDKPNDHYIGELFGGGVVVAVWQENGIEKCLIAGPENISTVRSEVYTTGGRFGTTIAQYFLDYGFEWGSANIDGGNVGGFDLPVTPLLIGASYSSFGATNSNIIGNYTNSNPLAVIPYFAAERCLDYINPDLGTGVWDDWFLPAIFELNHLINNAAIFNKVLESFASDSGRVTKDVVNNQEGYDYFNDVTYTRTTSFTQTDINLVEINGTKYTTNTTPWFGLPYTQTTTSNDYSPPLNTLGGGDGSSYLSSTEVNERNVFGISTSPWIYTTNPLTGLVTVERNPTLNTEQISKYFNGTVRPFRISDDTNLMFKFDWDYAIITYDFEGVDLDTNTRMISPSQSAGVTPFTQIDYETVSGGYNAFSSNHIGYSSKRPWYSGNQFEDGQVQPSIGYDPNGQIFYWSVFDYTPGIIQTVPAPVGRYNAPGIPGNNLAGTYSILWSSGDNRGTGKESILVNINAFKHHFPGQSEIEIELKAWWFNASSPTAPVKVSIDLYKGGSVSRIPWTFLPSGYPNADYYIWECTGYSASYSIASYPKEIISPISGVPTNDPYYGEMAWSKSTKVASFRYNVLAKNGYLKRD